MRMREDARLRADVVLVPLGEEAVAFSAEAQCLLGLNGPAVRVVKAMQEGATTAQVGHLLETQTMAPAGAGSDWTAATLAALEAHGMLEGAPLPSATPEAVTGDLLGGDVEIPPLPAYAPAGEQRYQLLETCVLIRFGDMAQARWLNSVIGHLAVDAPRVPNTIIDITATDLDDGELRSDIYRDGVPLGCAMRISRLAPMVKAVLWQSAINAHDYFLNLHAGVVGAGESCVVMPAASGSGKSSLTAALVHRGFRYFSDEVALIGADFTVPPMPLSLAVKSTGWDVIAPYFPILNSLRVHIRGDAKALRYLPPPQHSIGLARGPVRHVVFPRYVPDAPTTLAAVPRLAALGRLMGECLTVRERLTLQNVTALVAWIAGLEFFELNFSSLDEAVEAIVQVTGYAPNVSGE